MGFAYAVKDEPSYNDFGHQETSDGKVVSGSYRVLLPDGRTQIMGYTVSGDSGYVAEVKYEGEAKYPEYKAAAYHAYPSHPTYHRPTYPSYPAPVEKVTEAAVVEEVAEVKAAVEEAVEETVVAAEPVAEVATEAVAEVEAEVEATTDSA